MFFLLLFFVGERGMILNLNASAQKADQNTYTKCPNTIMAVKNGLICNIIYILIRSSLPNKQTNTHTKSKQIKQEYDNNI